MGTWGLTRAAPLWIGARGLEFSWEYIEMGVHANIDLVFNCPPVQPDPQQYLAEFPLFLYKHIFIVPFFDGLLFILQFLHLSFAAAVFLWARRDVDADVTATATLGVLVYLALPTASRSFDLPFVVVVVV